MKHATCKEQATEFFEEASALNTDAPIFDLQKQFFKDMCNWKRTLLGSTAKQRLVKT
jgi:hypothetical protein